ncbi:MAG TPA: hypothetical protein TECP_01032 [Hyphomicrobiaceae bacterium MAG_BT-2024]
MSSEENALDYEALTQDAMRSVVRRVLERTVNQGLPGDHHFYISFDTLIPGVILSKRLRERYEDEMTIVLQHRFWDLAIGEEYFEVKLTFDGIPERLVVPFEAIKVFFDPSVRYGLQFESRTKDGSMVSPPATPGRGDNEPFSPTSAEIQMRDLTVHDKTTVIKDKTPHNARGNHLHNILVKAEAKFEGNAQENKTTEDADSENKSLSANIVRLDAFRKK